MHTDSESLECDLFRARVWGKTLVTSIGVKRVQGPIYRLGSIKADAVSVTLWESLGTLSVVFWAKENGQRKHVEIDCKDKVINEDESQC